MSILSAKIHPRPAYAKHLPTTTTNVIIILGCTTIQYPSLASHVLQMQTDMVGQRADSDYESDPNPAGHEHDILLGDVV